MWEISEATKEEIKEEIRKSKEKEADKNIFWRVIVYYYANGKDEPLFTSKPYESEELAQAKADDIEDRWIIDYEKVTIQVQGFYK